MLAPAEPLGSWWRQSQPACLWEAPVGSSSLIVKIKEGEGGKEGDAEEAERRKEREGR